MRVRLGVVTTHPIQYQVPWFRSLARHPAVDLKVFFCMIPSGEQQAAEFGNSFQWDLPLLEGYDWELLENVSKQASLVDFHGCDTPGIYQVIRDRDFDAILVNGWVVKSCLQTLAACRLNGVPCLVRGESNSFRPRPPWVRAAQRLLLRQYTAFLAIGQSNRDFYQKNGVPPEKIFWTPYGVDNQRFFRGARNLIRERPQIRTRFGIPDGASTFLFCGKLIHKKRPLDLMQGFAEAYRRTQTNGNQSLHLLVVGDGNLRHECESFAASHNLPVTFAGFLNQTEIPQAYMAADCLVLPSDHGETWGLVVNEAMTCGRPAIVSDRVGCHPDLIESGKTGRVFPFGDIRALADCLAAFSREPAKLCEMGRLARRRVSQYGPNQAARGCLEALDYVTGHPKTVSESGLARLPNQPGKSLDDLMPKLERRATP